MLARYKIYDRRRRPDHDPKPEGICKDTRKHQRHCLSPEMGMVMEYLRNPSDQTWKVFKQKYIRLLKDRFKERRAEFDELAELATRNDVHIGCSCPTQGNPETPDGIRCHTVLSLEFMKQKYPELTVVFPKKTGNPD